MGNQFKRIVFILSFCQFLAMQVWFNFSSIIPVLEKEWGLSSTQSGIIIGFFHLGYVVAVFFYSFLSDKYNPKYLFTIGTLIAGLSGIIFSFFASGFWSSLILRTITGIGIAGVYVPGMRLLAELAPKDQRGRTIGFYVGSLVIGSGFSLLVSGALINSIGYQGVMLVTSVFCIFSSIIILYLKVPDVKLSSYKLSFSLLKKVLKKKNLLVNVSYAGHCWELYAMWAWIGPFLVYYFVQRGLDSNSALTVGNIIASCVIMIGGYASFFGGKASDRFGRIKAISIFIVISIICSLTIGWLTFLPLALFFSILLIYGFTIIADSPIYNTLITEIVEEEYTGLALGIQSIIGFGFTIVSPIFFGVMLQLFGWGIAFTSLGLITLITPLCLRMLKRYYYHDELHSPINS